MEVLMKADCKTQSFGQFLVLLVLFLFPLSCVQQPNNIHTEKPPPPPPPPDDTHRKPPPDAGPREPPKAYCGDGKVNGSEQCEPGLPLGRSCVSYGYQSGTLRCTNCRYDTSQCTGRRIIYRRRRGSCPYVYLWNGRGYTYHGDLSGSVLGYGLKFFKTEYYGDNIYKLGAFKAINGEYRMRLREVVFESSFFDKAALYLVDAPPGYEVYNQWSFTSQLDRKPSLKFVTARNAKGPISARLSNGVSVLKQLRHADGVPLPVEKNGLSRVIVDFGPIKRPRYAKLIVTSWGFYGDLRKHQRPPYSSGTVIETRDRAGRWRVIKTAGKSAGDSKTFAVDLGGLLSKNKTEMRITMAHLPSVPDVLDAVAIDDSVPVKIKVTRILPALARLRFGGTTDVIPSSLKNRIKARDVKRPVIPLAYMKGRFTRYGDVLPLLTKTDDRFVVMAHGDELFLKFKDTPRARGRQRKVFLLADVMYTLKYHPFGLLTESINPLPFHGMKSYPYRRSRWPYRRDAGYARYLKQWNTRVHR
jgi:hypothetical protein